MTATSTSHSRSPLQAIKIYLPGILAFGLLVILPFVGVDDFTLFETTYWLIAGLLALSLTFAWGVGGIFSVGQTAFFGFAGYTYGVISTNWDSAVGTVIALVIAAIAGGLGAALLGYFMFYGQVGSLFVAIITLATTLILFNLFGSTSGDQYTIGEAALGGFNGMQRVPTILDLGFRGYYWFVVAIAGLVLAGLYWIYHHPFGRVFNATRVNEERTSLLGYDVRAIKIRGYVISGALAGVAGALHTSWGNTINPTVFSLNQVIIVATWVMVGGRTRLWGAFLGAALIQWLSSYLGTFAQQATPLIIGSVLILLVLLLPEGIAPFLEMLWRKIVPVGESLPDLSISEMKDHGDPMPARSAEYDILSVEDLRRRFGNFWAVDGVDLSFKSGQAYCIIGPNGAGKSTFFNLLTGRLSPTVGQVIYDGDPITTLMPHERAQRGISIKLQVPNVYQELSVYDNLWLAAAMRYRDPRHQQIHIAAILNEIGLQDQITKTAGELSHGEKQWLEIGMAAVTHPSLLLLDEPTGGMSRGETLRTVELVKRLAQRSTVIVVEHDMEFVRQLDARVTVFAQGKVFTQGSIETIQRDEQVLEIYLGKAHAHA